MKSGYLKSKSSFNTTKRHHFRQLKQLKITTATQWNKYKVKCTVYQLFKWLSDSENNLNEINKQNNNWRKL